MCCCTVAEGEEVAVLVRGVGEEGEEAWSEFACDREAEEALRSRSGVS